MRTSTRIYWRIIPTQLQTKIGQTKSHGQEVAVGTRQEIPKQHHSTQLLYVCAQTFSRTHRTLCTWSAPKSFFVGRSATATQTATAIGAGLSDNGFGITHGSDLLLWSSEVLCLGFGAVLPDERIVVKSTEYLPKIRLFAGDAQIHIVPCVAVRVAVRVSLCHHVLAVADALLMPCLLRQHTENIFETTSSIMLDVNWHEDNFFFHREMCFARKSFEKCTMNTHTKERSLPSKSVHVPAVELVLNNYGVAPKQMRYCRSCQFLFNVFYHNSLHRILHLISSFCYICLLQYYLM